MKAIYTNVAIKQGCKAIQVKGRLMTLSIIQQIPHRKKIV